MMRLESYIADQWTINSKQRGQSRPLHSAVTGKQIGELGGVPIDTRLMLDHARRVGGPALRSMSFHQRAKALKALAAYLDQHKAQLTLLSTLTGATHADSATDIEGGIGTVFVYASKGRREMPDTDVYLDGELEALSRRGSFVGQHIAVPKQGVAIQINAFNFPVWGMLEKLAPAILAGMPVVIKPATSTAFVAEACFRLMLDSGQLPAGSVQLLLGNTGELLDQLNCQDVVSFTGSAQTAMQLRLNPHLMRHSVPFIAEQDSLNASLLGPDVTRDSPEFGLFVDEICKEITHKAGQKCTAIRRIIAPDQLLPQVIEAVIDKLSLIRIGDPALHTTTMGALVSQQQRQAVRDTVALLKSEATVVCGEGVPDVDGADPETGAFLSPMLLHCTDPDAASLIHTEEAFGPVATIMPYRNIEHGCQILNRGGGSLVASIISNDPGVARQISQHSAAYHGRLYFNNRHSMAESTGHGSPLPHMVHGGPGRAGGGEELGGIRGVLHYMQRTAIQGSPDIITAIGDTWIPGSEQRKRGTHPFTKSFETLKIGDTLVTPSRTISSSDIEQFAHFTHDTFYAHMDEAAAAASPFFDGRVAHGYLLLSFAAGLFVHPDPGPVLANTGLNNLVFKKPVAAGDSISVTLTVKRKTRRTDNYGEVRWHVDIFNQNSEIVASYELVTMNAYELRSNTAP